MDAIGPIQPIITQPVANPSAQGAQLLPDPAANAAPLLNGASTDQAAAYNPQAADQQRLQAVQKSAQNIANIYVVSDKIFTIFKDATGQYITRFTSLRDGKVTYIPEPQLFKIDGNAGPTIKIEA